MKNDFLLYLLGVSVNMDANGRLYTVGQIVKSPIHSILISQ